MMQSDAASLGKSTERSGRLWGARADFVASLGKKVSAIRDALDAFRKSADDVELRDDLRRKLHALATAARLLRFDAMAKSLADVETRLEDGSAIDGAVFEEIGVALDDVPSLAWRENPARISARLQKGKEGGTALATMVLLVGGGDLHFSLVAGDDDDRRFDVERTDDPQAAIDVAKELAPDLMILDASAFAAAELVEAMSDDSMTDAIPILVVVDGAARDVRENEARFVALGVSKVVRGPLSGAELRTRAVKLMDERQDRTVRVTLGEPTVEQLGDRLAEEVRRALTAGVAMGSIDTRVKLGDGAEVLGAIWGAIARVREVVTARTGGGVRFASDGPEGSMALAPWLGSEGLGNTRASSRVRIPASDVRLDGRRVIVADDDPAVTWFVADLLRSAGCEVLEALDGQKALDLAFRTSPDLVISDILMPSLDGFGLCRALRHDVVLRDTPVILLSWKEDLLQRVRELGASAAAYLRKESDSRAIVARVREVMRPRTRIEARFAGDGDVRGRIEGMSVVSLLKLVAKKRPNARLSLRDASFLYEMEFRRGEIQRVVRMAEGGGFEAGDKALASMLGAQAARFLVTEASGGVEGSIGGTVEGLLEDVIAHARGSLATVTGASLARVNRVTFDRPLVDACLASTPEPMKGALSRIVAGANVRDVLVDGTISPALLEESFALLASQGAVMSVSDADGADLLSPAVRSAFERAREEAKVRADEAKADVTSSAIGSPPTSIRDAAPHLHVRSTAPAVDEVAPSSLADAVMNELIGKTPMPPFVAPADVPTTPDVPVAVEFEPTSSRDELTTRLPPRVRVIASGKAKRTSSWMLPALSVGITLAAFGVLLAVKSAGPAPASKIAPTVARGEVSEEAHVAASDEASFAELPTGVTTSESEGWLEITAPEGAAVFVDGKEAGRGPKVATALRGGVHEVRVGEDGARRILEVRSRTATRIAFTRAP
ncbi:MAG: response regulator [Polyangiaceae bacterium]